MSDLSAFLKELVDQPGLSGHEGPVQELIEENWRPMVDEIHISKLGSVEALKKGTGKEPRKKILLAGHMDAIGMIVTRVEKGLIWFTSVGGVDPRVLPGQLVYVHGKELLTGVVALPPSQVLQDHNPGTPVPLHQLFIDIGYEADEVEKLVEPGNLISYAQKPVELSDNFMAGHTMDDRTAVAAITHCLDILQKRKHVWDVWAVATVQEEVSFGGAYTSTYGIDPDIGVAIDVSFAKGPGSSEPTIGDLDKGPYIVGGANIHPKLNKAFLEICNDLEIPNQPEYSPGASGTDAYAVQVVKAGRPTMLIGIPLRYMHTPVEMVSIKDIKRIGRLLAEFITALEEDYLETIEWDEKDE